MSVCTVQRDGRGRDTWQSAWGDSSCGVRVAHVVGSVPNFVSICAALATRGSGGRIEGSGYVSTPSLLSSAATGRLRFSITSAAVCPLP